MNAADIDEAFRRILAGDKSPAEQRVEGRAERIDAAIGDMAKHVRAAAREVQGTRSRQAVYWKLKLVADDLAQHVQKETPCRKGCSACCHIAVPISRNMARRLATVSGRPFNPEAGRPAEEFMARGRKDEYALEHYGNPCPFLGGDGACTIYEHRPIVCRAHNSLADDPSPCEVGKPYGKVPSYNMQWIEQLEAAHDLDDLWGDIREFFGGP